MFPEISIIIPVYNAEKSLNSTLNSILNQGYSSWEVIIVNDGSTDNSANVVKTFLDSENLIKLINQPNLGVVEARKKGLVNAKGNFIFFVDADDQLPEKALQILVAKQKESNADIVSGAHNSISKNTSSIICPKIIDNADAVELTKAILKGNLLSTMWGNLYKKYLFDTVIDYPMLKIGEDLCMNLLLVNQNNIKISLTDQVVYNYYVHENSVMQNTDENSGWARMSFLNYLENFLNQRGVLNAVEKELGFRYTQILVWLIFNNQSKILKDNSLKIKFLNYYKISRPILLPYMRKICQLHFLSPILCQLIIRCKKK